MTSIYGIKVLKYDFSGVEKAQVQIKPVVSTNWFIGYNPPFINEMRSGELLISTKMSSNEFAAYEKLKTKRLEPSDSNLRIIIQKYDLNLVPNGSSEIPTSRDFELKGLLEAKNSIVVYGNVGGAGLRKGVLKTISHDFNPVNELIFSISNEISISKAIFYKDEIWLSGTTGFVQVRTGSVVQAGDAFVGRITEGKFVAEKIFGTDRDDGVSELTEFQNQLLVTGHLNGPITHTGDNDKSLNYQDWFLGFLKR